MPKDRTPSTGYEGHPTPREQGPDIPSKTHRYECKIEDWLNGNLLVIVSKDGEIWRSILVEDQAEAEWISKNLTGTREKTSTTLEND